MTYKYKHVCLIFIIFFILLNLCLVFISCSPTSHAATTTYSWKQYLIKITDNFIATNHNEYLRLDSKSNDKIAFLFRYYAKDNMVKLINYYKDGMSKGQRIESQGERLVAAHRAIVLTITDDSCNYITKIILIPDLEMHIGYVGIDSNFNSYIEKIISIERN